MEKNEYALSGQLLRSGTSVGAIIREAEHAEATNDNMDAIYIIKLITAMLMSVKKTTQTVSFSFTAVPNIGGYDYNFSFPIPRRTYDLNCRCGKKFNITVKGYGKKVATI